MDLFEYQGKQFFARYGIPVSDGAPVTTVDEAVAAADRIGYPVVVKAQVQVGGRGKAGGIKLAANADEVPRRTPSNILGHGHQGPRRQGRLDRARLATSPRSTTPRFTLDRAAKKHLGMLSAAGRRRDRAGGRGRTPTPSPRSAIDPVDGLTEAAAPGLGRGGQARTPRPPTARSTSCCKLYRAYVEGDADLVEINPLILTPDGRGARPRRQGHASTTTPPSATPSGTSTDATQVRDEREQLAHEKGLQYVGLDGSVGIIANGAGLAMSTLDVVNQVGGSPANFLDIGGGANADVMAGALEVINNDPNVRSIFINIFGGITQGEEVANGIVAGARPGRDRRARS